MVFLIDLPPLAEGASFIPTSFSTELFRFLRALGLEDRLVSTLEKYDFSETRRYGFVHTMYALSPPAFVPRSSQVANCLPVLAHTPEKIGRTRVRLPRCTDI